MIEPHAIAAALSWVMGETRDVFPAALGAFSRVSAPAAVAALWQGVAVALTLALCLRFAPRVSASHRFAAWAAGFAVVVCLPFLPLVLTLLAHGTAGSQIPLHRATTWFRLDSRWGFAIAAVWFAASLPRATALGIHSLRLRKLWKTATPVQCEASLAVKAFARRRVEICTTRHLDRPSVIGFFAPRILIPDWLFDRLTPAELEQVVLHEGEHLRRHDDWINLLQKLALVLFPLNPALAWMERRLCREREMACDEGVVDRTQAPRAYAACLTSLAERGLERSLDRRAQALSLGAWQRRPELVRRVHSILCGKRAMHPLASRVLVGVVACGLLLASIELARCPQMVAFVRAPQPHPVDLAQIHPASPPAANGPEAFRAIPAKAILPGNTSATVGDAPAYHALRRPQPAVSGEVASREILAEPRRHETYQQMIEASVSTASDLAAVQAPESQREPQYIVLTAWEEVQTAPQGSRKFADYDTNVPAQQPTDAKTNITVTRLIFAIYSVPAPDASTSGSQKTESSEPVRPTAPPAASGWLVFQL